MAAMSKQEQGFTIQGWHVLAGMLAFFGIIFTVNAVFLVSALRTHTGIVSQQPYRKGLDYNNRISAYARQKALGWSHAVEIDMARKQVRLTLVDRHGRPVSGLLVNGFIGRPATEQYDRAVSLVETAKPGTYSADVEDLSPGNWLVQIEASEQRTGSSEIVYRLRKRLWLKP